MCVTGGAPCRIRSASCDEPAERDGPSSHCSPAFDVVTAYVRFARLRKISASSVRDVGCQRSDASGTVYDGTCTRFASSP